MAKAKSRLEITSQAGGENRLKNDSVTGLSGLCKPGTVPGNVCVNKAPGNP